MTGSRGMEAWTAQGVRPGEPQYEPKHFLLRAPTLLKAPIG